MLSKKRITQIIKEEVGVPSGIYDNAVKLTNILKTKIKDFPNQYSEIDNELYTKKINFSPPMEIGGMEFEYFHIVIDVHPQDNLDSAQLMGLGVPSFVGNPDLSKKNSKLSVDIDKDKIFLKISFAIQEDEYTQIEDWFNLDENVRYIITNITHELKHIFDSTKRKSQSLNKRVDYQSYSNFIRELPVCESFRNLVFLLYYVHEIENMVRPSELYAHMMGNNITKEKFLEELKKTDIFTYLLKGKNWSVENLKTELLSDIDCVKDILEQMGEDFEGLEDSDTVLLFMRNILKFFKLFSKKTFNDLLNSFDTTSRLDALSQLSRLFNIRKTPENINRDKRLEEYLRQFTKYGNNYEKVLFNYEKRINFESERVMKNISKIYSLLPSENESELHSKINKKTMKESYINYEFYKKKMEEEMKQPNFFKKYLDEYNMNSKNENPPPKK
jgi:hypothetical protein